MKGDNIIQKQILHLHMHKPVASAFAIQEAASKWCSEVLVDALGKVLEKYASIENVICIDKLEVTIDGGEDLNDALARRIVFELEREIQTRINEQRVMEVTSAETTMQSLLFFFQHGYLPWWSNIKQIEDISLQKPFDNEWRRKLKELLKQKSVVNRVATSLSRKNFVAAMSQVFELSESQIEVYLKKMDRLASVIKDADQRNQFSVLVKQELIPVFKREKNETGLIEFAIDAFLNKYQVAKDELKHHISQDEILSTDILLNNVLFSSTGATADELRDTNNIFLSANADNANSELLNKQQLQIENRSLLLKQDGIYILNAGMVILAPFIPRFFENLGVVADNSFNSKDLGLAVLQWLITGNELYSEADLVLPKILCGMEPEEPITIVPHLPDGFKNEGETLLQSIIEHWSILKNTSIAGLRESFLQREGKLSFQKNEWCLQVEQRPFDMLLQHLPWNIGMIRLSWMPYMLRTEWVG